MTMPIVMAGKQFNAWDLKSLAGDLAGRLREAAYACAVLQAQLQSWSDADLVALGLTQAEINALKGFFISDVQHVQAAIAASPWLKQIVGLGVYGYPTTVMPPIAPVMQPGLQSAPTSVSAPVPPPPPPDAPEPSAEEHRPQ
jgi:hypothetical protein